MVFYLTRCVLMAYPCKPTLCLVFPFCSYLAISNVCLVSPLKLDYIFVLVSRRYAPVPSLSSNHDRLAGVLRCLQVYNIPDVFFMRL